MSKSQRDELVAIKAVLKLVDGYARALPQHTLHAWDGGLMTWSEIRQHVKAALALEVLKSK